MTLLDEEQSDAAPDRSWWIVPGFVSGILGLVLSWVLLPDFFVNAPLFVAVVALIAWGFLAAMVLVQRRIESPFTDRLIVALVPYLALPFLVRLWARYAGVELPEFLILGAILEFAFLGLGYGIYAGLSLARWSRGGLGRLPSHASGVTGGVLIVVCLAGILSASTHVTPGSLFLFVLTAAVVSVALVAQRTAARMRWLGKPSWLATGPALAVAATQLFDGVVTYLSVLDPLGLAPRDFEEDIPLSRFILEYTGIGFPILKWALAILIAYALDGRRDQAAQPGTLSRLTFYLVLVTIGMGPSLYSGTQLL